MKRRSPRHAPAPRRSPTRRARSSRPNAAAARKKLESELNAKLAEAEKSIAATKTAAMANVRSIAEGAARAIVERLIGAAPSEKAVADAVTDVLKR